MCKEILSYLPKVVGIDIVELALWAKVHIKTFSIHCEHDFFVPLTSLSSLLLINRMPMLHSDFLELI
jgi:hypothetical protein